jgi:hypothetical protein
MRIPARALAALGFLGLGLGAEPPLDVGTRRQVFIDRRFVASGAGIELRMNPPRKLGVVLSGDKPWDAGWISGAGTVLEDHGVFRLWYTGMPVSPVMTKFRLCYAESADGIHWNKPDLGIYDWEGSKANNILMETAIENAGGVFIDPIAEPAQRYKLLAIVRGAGDGDGLYVYTSRDGLHWTLYPHRVAPFVPDTVNQAFFDTRLHKYVAYFRIWNPLRKVGRAEMRDILEPWPYDKDAKPTRAWKNPIHPPGLEFPTAFGYDESDPQVSDHYTSAAVEYPWADDAYLMFPSAFSHYQENDHDGPLDIQLAVSRDGLRFERVERRPYIDLGLAGTIDGGSMYMFIGMIRRGDEILQYYGGQAHTHAEYQRYSRLSGVGSVLCVAQRPDGFISLDAGMAGGSFVTPALRFSGSRLALNMNGSAMGEVRVELRDADGKAIDGFRFADCDPLRRNYLNQIVTWRGNPSLTSLASRPIRIAFRLRSVKLYAFQFLA